MRRCLITPALAVAALCVIAVPAVGAPHKAPRHKAPLGTIVNLRRTSVGPILVTAHGYTLYGFSLDTRNHDACVRIRECLNQWPALTTKAKPRAGHGVNSHLLGTIRVPDGTHQITYAGYPLYTYVQDTHPGEVDYVNLFQFGGTWPALNAAGKLVIGTAS